MSAVRASALLGTSQLYYKVTAFATFAVAARYLPAAALGDLFTALSFAGVLVVAVGLGMPSLIMRRVAQAPDSAGAEMSRVLGLRLSTLPIFVVAIAVAGAMLRAPAWPLWAAAAAVVAGEDAYVSVGAVFLGLSRPRINVAIGVAVQTAYALAAVAVIVATGAIDGFVAVQLARVAALLLVGWLVARRLFGDVRPRLRADVLHGAAPFALASALRGISEQSDSVLVGLLTPSEEMAHYQLALRTVMASTFIPYAVAAAVFPTVSTRGLPASGIIVRGLGALVGLGVLVAIPLLLVPSPIAKILFGAEGQSVAPLLAAFAPLAPLWFAQIFLTSMLQAAGKERAVVVILGAGALLGVAVAVPGTIVHGAFGAVAARGVVVIAQIALSLILVRR